MWREMMIGTGCHHFFGIKIFVFLMPSCALFVTFFIGGRYAEATSGHVQFFYDGQHGGANQTNDHASEKIKIVRGNARYPI